MTVFFGEILRGISECTRLGPCFWDRGNVFPDADRPSPRNNCLLRMRTHQTLLTCVVASGPYGRRLDKLAANQSPRFAGVLDRKKNEIYYCGEVVTVGCDNLQGPEDWEALPSNGRWVANWPRRNLRTYHGQHEEDTRNPHEVQVRSSIFLLASVSFISLCEQTNWPWCRYYTRCGIPVVIMGETGCGKTRLIRYMCGLQAGPGDRATCSWWKYEQPISGMCTH